MGGYVFTGVCLLTGRGQGREMKGYPWMGQWHPTSPPFPDGTGCPSTPSLLPLPPRQTTQQAVLLLRSRRRTFLFSKITTFLLKSTIKQNDKTKMTKSESTRKMSNKTDNVFCGTFRIDLILKISRKKNNKNVCLQNVHGNITR